jgi:hypothetical protein
VRPCKFARDCSRTSRSAAARSRTYTKQVYDCVGRKTAVAAGPTRLAGGTRQARMLSWRRARPQVTGWP